MGATKQKKVKTDETQEIIAQEVAAETSTVAKPHRAKGRSGAYHFRRSQVDKTQNYPADKAVDLVKKLSRTKHPTITADVNYRDESFQTEVSFPHSTGKSVRVAIATDELLKDIQAGKIEFDILIAKPDMMGKIAKFARVLGPRGLMPNPKNRTVTPNPEKRKAELESGKLTIKTEKKAPLLHIQIGNIGMDTKDLVENLKALVKALNAPKIVRLTISSTMSPGVKVDVSSLVTE